MIFGPCGRPQNWREIAEMVAVAVGIPCLIGALAWLWEASHAQQ